MNNDARDAYLSRRRLLQIGGSAAVVLTGSGLLVACGSNTGAPAQQSSTPKQGGVLTIGLITGGDSETLDPGLLSQWPDTTRGPMLYNKLFTVSQDLKLLPALAISADSDATATKWTLKLRDGVTWHDGKPFGADDVVAAFQGWSQAANLNNGPLLGIVDFANVKKTGPLEVQVPLLRPVAQFPTVLTIWTGHIPQAGATPASFATNPIGTGPFKFKSFTPGKRSEFVRNPNYWEQGKPYFDSIVVDSSFTDESARLNAFLGGQVNSLSLIPFATAKQQENSGAMKIIRSDGGQNYMLSCRIDQPPFDDVRVRQALKLMIDRQAVVDTAFAGYAKPFNDVFGNPALEYFDSSLKAAYDPDKAKSLLKAAGQEDLTFDLPIAPAAPGFVEAATVIAQQAKASGVTVNLQNIPTANYYSATPGNYTFRTIQFDATPGYASLVPYYRSFLTTGAPGASSHWASPEHDQQIYDAMAEVDPAKATEKWAEVQKTQFDEGGVCVYADTDFLDAVAPSVFGLEAGRAFPYNDMRFQDGWIG